MPKKKRGLNVANQLSAKGQKGFRRKATRSPADTTNKENINPQSCRKLVYPVTPVGKKLHIDMHDDGTAVSTVLPPTATGGFYYSTSNG